MDAARTEINHGEGRFFTPVAGSFHDFQVDLVDDPDEPTCPGVSVRNAGSAWTPGI